MNLTFREKLADTIKMGLIIFIITLLIEEKYLTWPIQFFLGLGILTYLFIRYKFNYIHISSIVRVYSIVFLIVNYETVLKFKDVFVILISLIIATLFYESYIFNKDKDNKSLPKLMTKRRRDLERLKLVLESEYLIGLNGNYGSGKSLIIEYLKREAKKEDYYFIEIDLLSSSFEDLNFILINEIDKYLKRHRVFSRYSPKLKSFFRSNQFLKSLGLQFFYDDTILINMISGLRREVD